MNARERKLVRTVLSLVGGFGLILGIRSILVKPLKVLDNQIRQVRLGLQTVQKEQQAYFASDNFLKSQARRTFAPEVDSATAAMGAMLNQKIVQLGLREESFTRVPVGPVKLRGAREVGWSVQGEGGLEKIVDLVYLLEASPALHRIQNLVLSASDQPGRVRVRFRFVTLVLDPSPEVKRQDLAITASLKSEERQLYAGILERDLFRPYIRRDPAAAPETKVAQPAPPPAPAGPNLKAFRIISLSTWNGQAEALIRDLEKNQTLACRPGQPLLDGQLLAIDYRTMPMHGNPLLQSFSRLIWKVGDGLYAVEKGQTLADKFPIPADQLPPGLNP